MINLIWDMDGTLIDSYDSIIDNIVIALNELNVSYEKEFIRDMVQDSTSAFFRYVCANNNVDYEKLWDVTNNLKIDISKIRLMPNIKETLELLNNKGVMNYIFTHRGETTQSILSNLKIEKYFIEVVTGTNGFKNKPDPEAINYLINKYNMVRNNTYYIGDRLMDQQCALNAGIGRIYYQSYLKTKLNREDYDYYVNNAKQILDLDIFNR